MTAEEKLKELYFSQMPTQKVTYGKKWDQEGHATIHIEGNSGVNLASSDIDLIANLVVERLKNG